MSTILYNTPIGTASITAVDDYISRISITDVVVPQSDMPTSPILQQAVQQLDQYFAGLRTVFDLPLKQAGTDFQQSVWKELTNIDYGKTISYATLSERMGSPLAIRAIAAANGKNNLWIIVPCHRVIGSNGELTGYAGGLWRKQWLLEHEAKVLGVGQTKLVF